MLVYLTYLEPVSGVYDGQVIDVCDHLRSSLNVDTRLIAILSPRDFRKQRSRLAARSPGATAVRSLFGWRAWPVARRALVSQITAALPSHTSAILARGPIAASLALDLRGNAGVRRVGYDGRGAAAAEWAEYPVAPNQRWKARIGELERKAVLESDARIAVSHALVTYWRNTWSYSGDGHVVIPCTISQHHHDPLMTRAELAQRRRGFGFEEEQIVLCYAGSAAEWQSLVDLGPYLLALLEQDPRVTLLLMTAADLAATPLMKRYAHRVRQIWVRPEEVRATMALADFGLLLREPTTTNRVAAPTKFAEYLAAGLQVMISRGVGDYSQIVQEHRLGIVTDLTDAPPSLIRPKHADRARAAAFARSHFLKSCHNEGYRKVLSALGFSDTARS